MNQRKEQRPDNLTDGGKTVSSIGLNNPDYNYRIVGKDKNLQDYDRIGRHKDLGYEVVKENSRTVVMACPKEAHERRLKERSDKANRNMDAAVRASISGDGSIKLNNSDFQLEKGELSND